MTTNARPIETIKQYRNAGYPAVAVETYEEARIIDTILAMFPGHSASKIDASQTLTDLRASRATAGQTFKDTFAKFASKDDQLLFVCDYQHIIAGPQGYRPLFNALPAAKEHHTMIVLIGPSWKLPEELKHEIPVLQIPLPDQQELGAALSLIEESCKAEGITETLTADRRTALQAAARGLTLSEAENAFALSAISNGFTPALVEREKMRLVRSEYMTVEAPADPASVGGLDNLKKYIREEVLPAANDPQLGVRAILEVGVPGTGKSLSAKSMGAVLGWPMIRLDLAACKGSLVGQSEANIRAALRTADAVAPCVLWIDELEKAVGGFASSSQTDGGTTLAMVGTLLTWMQEHVSPVLLVATCNDYSKLPPEMTRAGRFDERFFLDLPTAGERAQIAAIHIARLNCPAEKLIPQIADLTTDWTGAEIEQLIKSAARRTGRQLTAEALTAAAKEIIPISRSANVKELRDWATDHLRRANSDEAAHTGIRKLKTAPPEGDRDGLGIAGLVMGTGRSGNA